MKKNIMKLFAIVMIIFILVNITKIGYAGITITNHTNAYMKIESLISDIILLLIGTSIILLVIEFKKTEKSKRFKLILKWMICFIISFYFKEFDNYGGLGLKYDFLIYRMISLITIIIINIYLLKKICLKGENENVRDDKN